MWSHDDAVLIAYSAFRHVAGVFQIAFPMSPHLAFPFATIHETTTGSAWWPLTAFLSAFFCSVIAAPLIARLALRLKIVDAPDGHRKLHARPIPLTGGMTILVSLAVAVGITLWIYPGLLAKTSGDTKFMIGLFASSALIVLVGLVDDRFGLRGRQKLAGQIIAALVLVVVPREAGIVFNSVSLFGYTIQFGDFGPLMTTVFLVGAINALNLIDGVDGLASTTGIVLSLSVAAVAAILPNRPDGLMVALILAGALSGFLVFNFPPARMFLGDSGSMLIGLVLGAVALKCSMKGYTTAALVMPTAIWAIPLFDTLMAIVRRKLTGRSIYHTDRGHLHHCLQRKGLSGARLLAVVAVLCATTGLGAVAATTVSHRGAGELSGFGLWVGDTLGSILPSRGGEIIAVIGVVTAVSVLVVTRSFGHTEMSLLSTRLRRLIFSMLQRGVPAQEVLHDEEFPLHGDHNWKQLWVTLTEFAERFEMDSVELMVTLPRIGEEYHASWKRKTDTEAHEEWRSEIPLIVQDMRVGYIRVVGAVGDGSICKWMSDLIGGLQSFEDELVQLIEELRRERLGDDADTTASPERPLSQPSLFDSEQFILPKTS